jgi:hypothetical protein
MELLSLSGNVRKTLAFRRRLQFDRYSKGFKDSRGQVIKILQICFRLHPGTLETLKPKAIGFNR